MLILIFDTEQEKCKFELIYEKYKKYVMYTIKRFICDDFLAEDLFHNVFIVIANHLDNINMEQEKETKNYNIKFGYKPTLKSRIISKKCLWKNKCKKKIY